MNIIQTRNQQSEPIFYNETSLNGKYQVMTVQSLNGGGIKKIGSDYIHLHNNKMYKNLNKYWISKIQLEKIRNSDNSIRTSFN